VNALKTFAASLLLTAGVAACTAGTSLYAPLAQRQNQYSRASATAPAGWGPAELQAAYHLPSSNDGSGQTVAIVDAFDNPHVAADLAAYRATYHLGAARFRKFNQEGREGNYPRGNVVWGSEIDLDVEMVSASCPKCTIYLIEARTDASSNLYAAEIEAVKLGTHIVSNSWGGDSALASGDAFEAPGVAYVASAGDGGYGMQDPAEYDNVVSVGGTVLVEQDGRFSESVWLYTGAGCSKVPKPAWQHDPRCTMRTGNDVAAVARHVAFYDTFGDRGWMTATGTSISAPLIGGIFGLAGNASSQVGGKHIWRLTHQRRATYLHAIDRGGISGCPKRLVGSYLCRAGTGEYATYSGPAGWGTPNGIGAF
jgi:subtilase family serine protease